MPRPEWVDIRFKEDEKETFNQRFLQRQGFVNGTKAFLNLSLLEQELQISQDEILKRLETTGYVKKDFNFGSLSKEMFATTKYRVRPLPEKYPNFVDCSSFVGGIYREFGIKIPRYTPQQIEVGQTITEVFPEVSDLKAGDLLFFNDPKIRDRWTSESGIEVSHVMLYIGNGQVIDASFYNKPTTVKVRNISEIGVLGRIHVGTKRYIEDFNNFTLFENETGVEQDSLEKLKKLLTQ